MIPICAVEVPVKINDRGRIYNTIFYGGFLLSGFDITKDSIYPQLDWAIIDATNDKPKKVEDPYDFIRRYR